MDKTYMNGLRREAVCWIGGMNAGQLVVRGSRLPVIRRIWPTCRLIVRDSLQPVVIWKLTRCRQLILGKCLESVISRVYRAGSRDRLPACTGQQSKLLLLLIKSMIKIT